MVRDSDGTAVSWMPGENVCLEMPGLDAHTVVVADAWDGSQTVEIVSRPEVEKETEVIAQQATSTSHAEAPVEEVRIGSPHRLPGTASQRPTTLAGAGEVHTNGAAQVFLFSRELGINAADMPYLSEMKYGQDYSRTTRNVPIPSTQTNPIKSL